MRFFDRFAGVAVEVVDAIDALLGGAFTVSELVVVRGDQSLVVGWHLAAAEPASHGLAPAPVDLRHGVTLQQILRIVAHFLDHAGERLQHRVRVARLGMEIEVVGDGGATRRQIIAQRHVNAVAHVVVEVVPVGSDAGLFERVHRHGRGQVRLALVVADERIDVGRVRCIV